MPKTILLLAIAISVLAGVGLSRALEAQSIGVGAAKITIPIVVNLDPLGTGLSGLVAHFTISGSGDISCLVGTEAGFNDCRRMQTVQLSVGDLNNIWGPGDEAGIGSITISGASGETKTGWLSVMKADGEDGNPLTSSPISIQVTIP